MLDASDHTVTRSPRPREGAASLGTRPTLQGRLDAILHSVRPSIRPAERVHGRHSHRLDPVILMALGGAEAEAELHGGAEAGGQGMAAGSEGESGPLSMTGSLRGSRVLIIDDDDGAARMLVRVLRHAGLVAIEVRNDPFEGLLAFDRNPPDLVFLDLHLPGCDGFEVLDRLRARPVREAVVPIVMLTGDGDIRHRRRALARGATDFLLKPFNPMEVILRARALLETRALQRELSGQNRLLEARVLQRTAALEAAQLEMLRRLAVTAELHDDDTGQHTQRVARLAGCLARALGLPATQAEQIEQASPLHDLGKIGIPDLIVRKPGPLSEEEYRLMRTHAEIGAQILAGGQSTLLQMAERIARSHHERWDGRGYPSGLAGEAIPLEARIVAVADFFDALTHDRPYRAAVSVPETIGMIRDGSGTHFDPAVAGALAAALQELDAPDRMPTP